MIKVELRTSKRFFESEDADFMIQAKEEKELPTRVLRSYHVKNYLLNGHLKLTEGELILNVKHSLLLFSSEHPDKAYGVEFGKFYIRDLDLWTISWEDEEHVIPADVKLKLVPELKVEEEESETKEDETEETKEPEEDETEDETDPALDEDGKYSKTDLVDKTKKEQIEILKEFGLESKEIRKLKNEELRVNKILELQE